MPQQENKSLFSHHIFTFPFQWDALTSHQTYAELTFSERTDISKLENFLDSSNWKVSPFEIGLNEEDQYHTFNEYNYFYGYVRDALAISVEPSSEAIKRYKYQIGQSKKPTFDIRIKGLDQSYQLLIKDILLTIYDVGVGYIAFFLENNQYSAKEDILRINDFGRRIYPQFLAYAKPENKEDFAPIDGPKGSFLADTIVVDGLFEKAVEEDFNYYDKIQCLNGEPFQLPKYIKKLLGNHFVVGTRESKQRSAQSSILLSPLIDDRMYVQCYYFIPEGLGDLQKFNGGIAEEYNYINDDFWYAYIFVDPSMSPTVRSQKMKKQLLQKHTYDRWIENKNPDGSPGGQLFGVTRYSFVMAVERCWFTENIIINHHRYIYFQMMALALTQRAAILRFSSEVSTISEMIVQKVKAKKLKKAIQEVYQEYLYFTNKIYFREITPQEQGIELYDMIRSSMEIDTDLKALQQEIAELHQYAVLLDNEEGNRKASILTILATVFLAPATVAGFYGFGNFDGENSYMTSIFEALFISTVIGVLSYLIVLGIVSLFYSRK